jgi:hypothetical protein
MLGYNLVSVGRNYVVMEDVVHVKEFRVPVYAYITAYVFGLGLALVAATW